MLCLHKESALLDILNSIARNVYKLPVNFVLSNKNFILFLVNSNITYKEFFPSEFKFMTTLNTSSNF